MDPDANITQQLACAGRILLIRDECDEDGEYTDDQLRELAHEAAMLAELVEALDGWITKRGFLPSRWDVK